jgi:hypothetical protein
MSSSASTNDDVDVSLDVIIRVAREVRRVAEVVRS